MILVQNRRQPLSGNSALIPETVIFTGIRKRYIMKFLQPVFLFFLIVLIPHTLLAQQLEKSEVLEQIGDQVFYIHLV
jgi:hypothetical protein